MAEFIIAYKKTAAIEGGYVNDPNDKGGETYMGISRRFHPDWEGWGIVDAFKNNHAINRGMIIDDPDLHEHVAGFYFDEFWNPLRLNWITSQAIANEIYDTAVNMGPKVAAKILQRALNLLNRDAKDYQDIPEDGVIGKETISLTEKYPMSDVLLKVLNGLQFSRYADICERDPSQEANFRGWLTRV